MKDNIEAKHIGNRKIIIEIRFEPKVTMLDKKGKLVEVLLCRPSGNGDTYSFKIKKKGMPLLFPESIIYNI